MDIYKLLNKEVLDYNDIKEIRNYHIDTSSEGVMVKTYDDFINKILLMIKLWPQKEGNTINYLFGSGIGIELALQGNVIGRKKNNNCYSYRPHNDIILYDVKIIDYEDEKDSYNFKEAFGNIEFYPSYELKVLSNINSNLLDNTCETVVINNHKVLIPELEILFLEKYLQRELVSREEGYDYELLFREYELDVDKIINYLEDYYIKPKISKDEKYYNGLLDKQIKAIERILNNGGKIVTNLENLELQIDSFPKGRNMNYAGISIDLWIPLSIKSISYKNKYYHIDDEKYLDKLRQRIKIYSETEYQRYEEIVVDIQNMARNKEKNNI